MLWDIYWWIAIVGGIIIGVKANKDDKRLGRYESDLVGLLTILFCIVVFPVALIATLMSSKD
jgi:hypothetical protein